MRKMKTGIITTALVIAGGTGLILGNQTMLSTVFAAGVDLSTADVSATIAAGIATGTHVTDGQTPEHFYVAIKNGDGYDIIVPGGAEGIDGAYTITKDAVSGGSTEISTTVTSKDANGQFVSPTDSELSEDEAKQAGIAAIKETFGLTDEAIANDFDFTVRGLYAAADFAETDGALKWNITATPKNQEKYPLILSYNAMVDDKQEEPAGCFAVNVVK